MTVETLNTHLSASPNATHALAELVLGAVFLVASPASAATCDGHGDWNYW